jgi:hypothetical protein
VTRARSRAGSRRILGAAALIALLALPLGLGGHHHATSDTTRDCSTCVVAHFSPLEVATPAILPTVVVSQSLLVAATSLAVTTVDRPAHPGRAPPAVLGDTAA